MIFEYKDDFHLTLVGKDMSCFSNSYCIILNWCVVCLRWKSYNIASSQKCQYAD